MKINNQIKITNKIHGVNKQRKGNNNLLLASSSVSDSSIYSSNMYNKTDIVKNVYERDKIQTIEKKNKGAEEKVLFCFGFAKPSVVCSFSSF